MLTGRANALQGLARLRARVPAVLDYRGAVHEHIRNARRIMVRVFVGGMVLILVGVEYHDVGPVALAQLAAAFEAERVRRQASGRAALTERGFGGTLPT